MNPRYSIFFFPLFFHFLHIHMSGLSHTPKSNFSGYFVIFFLQIYIKVFNSMGLTLLHLTFQNSPQILCLCRIRTTGSWIQYSYPLLPHSRLYYMCRICFHIVLLKSARKRCLSVSASSVKLCSSQVKQMLGRWKWSRERSMVKLSRDHYKGTRVFVFVACQQLNMRTVWANNMERIFRPVIHYPGCTEAPSSEDYSSGTSVFPQLLYLTSLSVKGRWSLEYVPAPMSPAERTKNTGFFFFFFFLNWAAFKASRKKTGWFQVPIKRCSEKKHN